MSKTNPGNFFEDFKLGQDIVHATPRTLTAGDAAVYQALYGARFALQSADTFALQLGLPAAPLDDMLVFHMVLGKSVPDISLNAFANLGYAEGRFQAPVYPGDTLAAHSRVIGLRENTSGKTGIAYVRTSAHNQRGEMVLSYVRWVMVNKRDASVPAPEPVVPQPAKFVDAGALHLPPGDFSAYDFAAAGASHRWGDYSVGERIDHRDGQTIEEAEHQLATRLYQNTAKVHFDQHLQKDTRFGRRLIYGGHIISIARALSFNGLENAVRVVALNGGAHVGPSFAGDTIYAWSEILDKAEAPGRTDMGFLRVRTHALKDQPAAEFPGRAADGSPHPALVLELDYWVAMPR